MKSIIKAETKLPILPQIQLAVLGAFGILTQKVTTYFSKFKIFF